MYERSAAFTLRPHVVETEMLEWCWCSISLTPLVALVGGVVLVAGLVPKA